MRVLVCGGRNFVDYGRIKAVLDELRGVEFLFAGDAQGADYLALAWAAGKGLANACFSACWAKHGKSAGPIRNGHMLTYGRPDLVIAFPGGRGTADTVRKAEAMDIEVRQIDA